MKLTDLYETNENNNMSDEPVQSIYQNLIVFLNEVADEFEEYSTTNTDMIPSAPNTQNFRAIRHGMIQSCKNITIHGDYYTPKQFFQCYLKIGSLVDEKIQNQIYDQVIKYFIEMGGTPVKGAVGVRPSYFLVSNDNWLIQCAITQGSAWGGIGFNFRDQNKKK